MTTGRPEDFVFEVRAGCGKDRLKEGGGMSRIHTKDVSASVAKRFRVVATSH